MRSSQTETTFSSHQTYEMWYIFAESIEIITSNSEIF